jgi:hypothetical protein
MLDLPDDPFPPFGQFFWLIAIGVGFVHTLFLWRRTVPQARPEQRPGYIRYVVGYFLANLVLWGVMGIGIMVGGIPSVYSYLQPASTDPYIIAFFTSIILLVTMLTIWVVFGGGANFFVQHPGLLNITHPLGIKLAASLMPLLMAIMLIGMSYVPPLVAVPGIVAGLAGLATVAREATMKTRH